MSDILKISGKRFKLPKSPPGWSFEPRPGGWVVAHSPEGARQRFAIRESQANLGLSLKGRLYSGELSVETRRGVGHAAAADTDLVAQFPGKVRKILVAPGDAIRAGQPLVLVEAMKMEFTIKAPYEGVMARILVQEGQQLAPGDLFFEISPGEGKSGG